MLATEIKEPDAVVSIGVSYAERLVVVSQIERNPLRFRPDGWVGEAAVRNESWDLLPRGVRESKKERITEVEAFFGSNGKFRSVKIRAR